MQHLSDIFMKCSGPLAANAGKKIDMCKSYTWDLALIIKFKLQCSLTDKPSEAVSSKASASSSSAQSRLPRHYLLAHSHNHNRIYRWRCSLLIDKRLQQLPHQGEHRSRCFGLRAIF